MRQILMRSIPFWALVGCVIGAGIDYLIGDSSDWGTGLLAGLVAGAGLGYLLRRRVR